MLSEFLCSFRDGLLWVEVQISSRAQPLQFLLDSGASASVININTARTLRAHLGSRVKVSGVNAEMTGYWPVKLSAQAGSVPLPTKYLALDLEKLSKACDRRIDGLIGADFFRERVVEIDYTAEKIRILKSETVGNNADSIPIDVRKCGLRIGVSVNGGKKQWVRLDTGCATALQWVTSTVRPTKCVDQRAVGFAELEIPQTMTGVQIGEHFLDTVPTGLHRDEIFPGEAGLLGNGVLAGFGSVIIDAKSGRLILGRASDW